MRAALLFCLLLTGCRSNPTVPTLPDPFAPISASTDAPGSQIAQTYDPIALGQVPELLGVTTEVSGGMWILRAQLRPRDPNPYYSATQVGGWSLQLLLNTDQQPTGYAQGYDWVALSNRLDEVDSPTIFGPIPACCDWGPAAGYAGLNLSVPERLTLSVPLSAIQDGGALNWRLETNVTIPCEECPGGVSSYNADLYLGATLGEPLASIRGSIRPQRPGRP